MPSFIAKRWSAGRSSIGRSAHARQRKLGRLEALRGPQAIGSNEGTRLIVATTSQSGFALIEVVVSALFVGLIVVGTLTGFDSAGRATADERAHNQATLLAGQDEERLRGLNVGELDQLGTASKTVTQNGTVFTITSSAQYVSAPENKLTCETSGGSANYLQTTSKVTWSALGSRAAVTQSSVVDVPASLTLLVKVWNQNHEGLAGANVAVSNRARTATAAEETTPESGCVIFGALPEKEVDVQATVPNYVNEAEEPVAAAPAKETTLSASTLTGPIEFTMGSPGSIIAEFESNGSTTGVTGDTFFATHTGVSAALVGGKAGTYGSTASLAGLFPFVTVGKPPTSNPYTIYAGDCAANSPATVAGAEIRSAQVEPGVIAPPHKKIEVPPLNLTVYKGTATGEGVLTTATSAKIINTACSNTGHEVKIASTGLLEQKYQPYAKELQVCVVGLVASKYYKSTQSGFSNAVKAGTSASFFLKKSVQQESLAPITC
jgi:Tfp pilus assembly protein PilV